jgi:hypothetical protein
MRDAGFEVHCVPAEQVLGTGHSPAALQEIDALMRRVQPDMVYYEADLSGALLHRLTKERRSAWHRQYGTQEVAYITDAHEHFHLNLELWAMEMDLLISLPFDGIGIRAHIESGKVLQTAFDPGARSADALPALPEKDIGFSFSGSVHRARFDLLGALMPLFEKHNVRMNNLGVRKLPVPYAEYRDILARSQFTLNCSLLHEYESPRGRTFEAIASGTLLLEQSGKAASQLYVPLVHFIPFMSMDQALIFTQFLIKHPEWRDQIAGEARRFHTAHYAADRIWTAVCAKLDSG